MIKKMFNKSILVGMALSLGVAAHAGLNDYSDGYRMGMLTKFSVKGTLFKTGEGELQMGFHSSPLEKMVKSDKGGEVSVKVNPWLFSAVDAQEQNVRDNVGRYVVVHYKQKYVSWFYDTDYRIEDITTVDAPSVAAPNNCVNTGAGGWKSEGNRAGRIVKLSNKGVAFKTWEGVMQLGDAGNQFFEFSITDDVMAKCALDWMKSGKIVNLEYAQSFVRNPVTQDTQYDVVKISVVPQQF